VGGLRQTDRAPAALAPRRIRAGIVLEVLVAALLVAALLRNG